MGWEKGQYYTRSRKVNGRVIREYVGGGEIGALAAKTDAIKREDRDYERELWRIEVEEVEAFDNSVEKVCQMADIIAKATLVAAGFHDHFGEWRRRRVRKENRT
jgi:hypothetical protein